MCERTGTVPALECTIADLKRGDEYHDPNGERWMVLCPAYGLTMGQDILVVNLGNGPGNRFGNALKNDEFKGISTVVRGDVKLGRDARGRLYASTALNDWYLPEDPAPPAGEPTPDTISPNDFIDLGSDPQPPAV